MDAEHLGQPPPAQGDERGRQPLGSEEPKTAERRTREAMEQAAARLHILAEVSRALSEAGLDLDAILRTVVREVAQRLGDGCILTLVAPDGERLDLAAVHHTAPGAAEVIARLLQQVPGRVGHGLCGRVIQAGRPLLLSEISPDEVRAATAPEHRAFVDQYPVHSALAVPLLHQGRVLGALMAARHNPGHPYTPEDQVLLEKLASRVALSMEAARLYEAERRARDRSAKLQRVAAALLQPLAPSQVADVVTREMHEAIGAAASVTYFAEAEGELRLAAWRGLSPQSMERLQRLPEDTPLGQAVRTARSVYHEDRDSLLRVHPSLAERDTTRTIGASCALPMVINEHVLGGVAFSFTGPRRFVEAEREFLETLSAHCALALERARLYQAERRARLLAEEAYAQAEESRREAEFLYHLTDTVSRAATLEETYQAALDGLRGALRVERAALLLFDEDGVMRFRAWRGLSAEYRRAVEGHSPWSEEDRRPQPVLIPDAQQAPAMDPYRDLFQAEGIAALAFIPLLCGDRLVGKCMLYYGRSHRFLDREVQLAQTVVDHVALAIERRQGEERMAALYQAEREARRQTEAEARAREELLAVVSHDLRNPLAAILLTGASLLRKLRREASPLLGKVETIQHAGERMNRLITDLLDLAQIESGRIGVRCAPQDLGRLLRETLNMLGPLAAQRAQRLESLVADEADEELVVDCDRERVQQVLSNLIGNAIKYTPEGGRITLSVRRDPDAVCLSIADTGPGIPAEQLPFIFERYWQGRRESSTGVGLGLSIAKGLIEAHGGRIWVDSTPGEGTTFSFTLPRHRGGTARSA